jgi:polar amino acid transport system substrate-binding protein
MIEAVADGQYDVAADGITITEERAGIVDFSEGYVSIDQRLMVRVDETRITEIEDIVNDNSLKIGAKTGTGFYYTAFQYLSSHERIHGFDTAISVVQALISGDIDALIVNDLDGIVIVGADEYGLVHLGEDADKVKFVGRTLNTDWLGFIYPKSSDLVEPVNMVLQSMMADGFLGDLNKKYFGPEFTITNDDIGPGAYGE